MRQSRFCATQTYALTKAVTLLTLRNQAAHCERSEAKFLSYPLRAKSLAYYY